MADAITIPIVGPEAVEALKGALEQLHSAVSVLFESDDETLLTEAEVAAIMRISPKTVANWRERDNGPPFIKFGQSIRYDRKALREWMRANTFRSTTEAQ